MKKSDWAHCRLGDAITLQRGFDLTEYERQEGNVPIVSSSGISGYHNVAKVAGPGVVTGRYGTLGEVFYIKEDFWPHNTTLYVRDFKGNDPLFISYFLKTLQFATQNAAGAVPGVNRNALHLLSIVLPPHPTQRRIASILSAYDDLIENNTRRIKILEEMAQRLYREWFVHFRFPGHEKVKMVKGVPEGWLKNLPDHVDFLEGPGLRRWQFKSAGVPFLNIRTLVDNDIDLSKVQYIDEQEMQQKYSHFLLQEFDHVVSSSGTIGRIVTIQKRHLPLMLNTSIIRMRSKTKSIGKWQLKHFLQSHYFQKQIQAYATGAAQMNYGPIHLKQMWIVAPTEHIGILYEKLVSPSEMMIGNLTRKNANLRRTRDMLLPKLVSGEVEVEIEL